MTLTSGCRKLFCQRHGKKTMHSTPESLNGGTCHARHAVLTPREAVQFAVLIEYFRAVSYEGRGRDTGNHMLQGM